LSKNEEFDKDKNFQKKNYCQFITDSEIDANHFVYGLTYALLHPSD